MIYFKNVSVKFNDGTQALSGVSFGIEPGEFVFIVGPSGAGKTTILRLLIRDILPTEGEIFFNDEQVNKLPSKRISQLRRKIGAVFQDYKLLADQTVGENIGMALEICGRKKEVINKEVEEILILCNLTEKKNCFPQQLSGGELQRVAIARALIIQPEVIFADEPTGNLDPGSSLEIVKLLEKINSSGKTVIMATHNAGIVDSLKKRVIVLKTGKIVSDQKEGKYKNL